MENTKIIARSFGTHSGSFHADEVTACALLLLFDLIDQDKIIRSRDLGRLKGCEYVCDVGGLYQPKIKRFDHHQSDYQGALSSAGMILKYLKDQQIMDETLYRYFNGSLVIGVDNVDNGKSTPIPGHCSFSTIIANFVPARHHLGEEAMDRAFHQAVSFTLGHLTRLRDKLAYIQECRQKIREEMQKKKNVLIFEQSMPWIESFFELGGDHHPALFVIMPVGDQWKLRGIPPTYSKRMQVRLPFPRTWAGLIDDELKKVAHISGAVFCHKGRFISIWKTKDDALKALDYVLSKKNG